MRANMLYIDQDGESVMIGAFVRRGTKVEIEAPAETRHAMDRILQRSLRDRFGERWSVKQGAERWLKLLPLNYDGARMRAELED